MDKPTKEDALLGRVTQEEERVVDLKSRTLATVTIFKQNFKIHRGTRKTQMNHLDHLSLGPQESRFQLVLRFVPSRSQGGCLGRQRGSRNAA